MGKRRNSSDERTSRSRRGSNNTAHTQPIPSTSRQRPPNPSFLSQTSSRMVEDDLNGTEVERSIEEDSYTFVKNALGLVTSGKPVKKADLLLGCRFAQRRSEHNEILERGEELLQSIYGLQLVQVSGKFILCSKKATRFRDELAERSALVSTQFSSLLCVVLTLIFIQKGQVDEDILMNTMLKKLFPDIKKSPHPFFGNVDKLMAEFEQQMYISKVTETRNGENKIFYKWGLRADIEFDKRALMTPLLSAMFGHNVPESVWSEMENEAGNDVAME